jgi:hypothetical protein
MLFRAVIYSVDNLITIVYPNNRGNWFSCNGRSYRKDRKAICQVLDKNNQIKGVVESLYIEGNSIPLRSDLRNEEQILEHYKELVSESTNRPKRGFWEQLFGRR